MSTAQEIILKRSVGMAAMAKILSLAENILTKQAMFAISKAWPKFRAKPLLRRSANMRKHAKIRKRSIAPKIKFRRYSIMDYGIKIAPAASVVKMVAM
jgi:hypothetical protein